MGIFDKYTVPNKCLDEVFDAATNNVKIPYETVAKVFETMNVEQFDKLHNLIKLSFFNQGITYQVYSENISQEHIFPFDPNTRLITSKKWDTREKGVIQRSRTLNMFLKDV